MHIVLLHSLICYRHKQSCPLWQLTDRKCIMDWVGRRATRPTPPRPTISVEGFLPIPNNVSIVSLWMEMNGLSRRKPFTEQPTTDWDQSTTEQYNSQSLRQQDMHLLLKSAAVPFRTSWCITSSSAVVRSTEIPWVSLILRPHYRSYRPDCIFPLFSGKKIWICPNQLLTGNGEKFPYNTSRTQSDFYRRHPNEKLKPSIKVM